jgi:hypothetical protein
VVACLPRGRHPGHPQEGLIPRFVASGLIGAGREASSSPSAGQTIHPGEGRPPAPNAQDSVDQQPGGLRVIGLIKKWLDAYRRIEATMDRLAAPVQDLPGGHERWVVDSMHWLLDEFGQEPLQRPTVLPPELLGSHFDGTQAATRSLFATMCRRMDVPFDQVELRFSPSLQATGIATPIAHSTAAPVSPYGPPAGRWTRVNGRSIVIIAPRLLSDPVALVAVLAHELGHELLIGSGRIKPSRPDQESLTDLLTVYYGFGIFAANASLALPRHPSGRGRAPFARGYLREEALAHALAYYCVLRGERRTPAWNKHLDFTVRMRIVGRIRQLRRAR